METIIVSSEDELAEQVEVHKARGLRLAAISNTGLPEGQARLTFLPLKAFKEPQST